MAKKMKQAVASIHRVVKQYNKFLTDMHQELKTLSNTLLTSMQTLHVESAYLVSLAQVVSLF